MAGDSLGLLFRVTNWGESHGLGVGVVIEGCPPGFTLREEDLQLELNRRRPGQSSLTTPRNEKDLVRIYSGLVKNKTTGAPISLIILNKDQRSHDYSNIEKIFRPSHADYTYQKKYGIRSVAGGGRSSARLTAGNVAAGAIAKIILKKWFNTEIIAYVKSVQNIEAKIEIDKLSFALVEKTPIRCPNLKVAKKMIKLIEKVKLEGNSIGGVIECLVRHVPIGLGEPIFDKLEADLAKAILSINACKGFEIGSGFEGTKMLGSEHNDIFKVRKGKVETLTNHSGGIQGGISNGMPIIFKAAFKPTSTILKTQTVLQENLKSKNFQVEGRHDPCVLPRAVPIVEAMAALVLVDHALRHRGHIGKFSK